jgi:S1-C subfamily serine protease
LATDTNRDAVVKIHVTQRRPDFYQPWTKVAPRKTAGTGAIIAGRRILTNEHVVQYASQIFVQANQTTDKIPATVEVASPEMDLAILKVEDDTFFEGRPGLEISEGIPNIRDTVNVYGYPIGGDDQSVTEGIISRIEFAKFNYEARGLRIQVDAALNPGNSGGPALVDNKIAGLVFSKIAQADNIGYLIPGEELLSFLRDVEDGTYDGQPTLFDELQVLENSALRSKLGLSDDTTGVMVREPYVIDDESYPLRAWDVITHVGEHSLDNQGDVHIRYDLRLDFRYRIPELVSDGKVPLTIVRDGKEERIEVPVLWRPKVLLPSLRGEYPSYYIHGPMVFTAATQDFVNNTGMRGRIFLSATRSPLIERQFDKPRFEGEELVAFSNRMFPHRITKGYSTMPFGVVSKVNDVPVQNLRHLATLLRDATGKYLVLTMAGNYETLVFDRTELAAATEQILEDEGIRYQSSSDLREFWLGG